MYGYSSYGKPPITEVTFEIGDDIQSCYSRLQSRGFKVIDGDIRQGWGGKFAALGYRRTPNKYPITNIIGFLSKDKPQQTIYEYGYPYMMIQDGNGNGDIHKGSKGDFLQLYYTCDPNVGMPIKELIFQSFKQEKNDMRECVQNYSGSLKKGDLDINAKRGGSFNYIFISR